MSTENTKVTTGVASTLISICIIAFFIFLFGNSVGKRTVRCNIACDMLNSKPIACESGVTVCSNNKIIWRKIGQP